MKEPTSDDSDNEQTHFIKNESKQKKIGKHKIRNFINLFKSQLRQKKKRFLTIFCVIIIFSIIMTSFFWGPEQIILVHHSSHVPGIKDTKTQVLALKSFATMSTRSSTTFPSATTISIRTTLLSQFITPRNINQTLKLISIQITSESNTIQINLFNNFTSKILPPPSGFLVWNDRCKIPDIDPYEKEIMKHFRRQYYEPCSKMKPLTSIEYNQSQRIYMLNVNESLRDHYQKFRSPLKCCYQSISRNLNADQPDNEISLGKCVSFTKTIPIPSTIEHILVRCQSRGKKTYANVHAMMPDKPNIKERFENWKQNSTKRPISVLMIGIDSISRINLIRAMPKTAQYLYDNEWFEMSGYNKMDDNTFPNLMAILTGFNDTTAYAKCKPKEIGGMEVCPMIWKTFQNYGYVTAYAEDETKISTFNYLKPGFIRQPVDYYLQPLMKQAEQSLPKKVKSGLKLCVGFQHSADYIYNYAFELGTRFKDDPYFGLFWTNTFSHNYISDPSCMDDKMLENLKTLSSRGILDRAVVIFFSDHGIRFGPTRKYLSGHLEERLPFMFIWLPQWIKNEHTEFVSALSMNKNRLTNPYDIHMTLKHILELTERKPTKLPNADDCPNCQTLFKPVPHNRSCEDIAIEDHWCTCIPFEETDKDSTLIKRIGNFVVSHLNKFLNSYKDKKGVNLCAKRTLNKILNAYKAVGVLTKSYRIVFNAKPANAEFEATVQYDHINDIFNLTGRISRIDSYEGQSNCVTGWDARKYCYCENLT